MENHNSVLKIKPLGFPWATRDPFLFCVYHADAYPEGDGAYAPAASLAGRNLGSDFQIKDGWRMYHGRTIPGFPVHPHRGFETVTVVRKGIVDHSDSLGGAGRYGHGDVQWMTAGKGIQHAEMFPLVNQDSPNPLELFQIWLNLPRKSTSENEVAIWYIEMEPKAGCSLPPASGDINRTLYFFFEGDQLAINGTAGASGNLAEVDAKHSIQLLNGNSTGRVLLLQGRSPKGCKAEFAPFLFGILVRFCSVLSRSEYLREFVDFEQQPGVRIEPQVFGLERGGEDKTLGGAVNN